MFTGLIEEVGVVRRLERGPAGGKLSVRARTVLEGTKIGDSIAVSGACLTVIALDGDGFVVECMPETLARTTHRPGGARGARQPGARAALGGPAGRPSGAGARGRRRRGARRPAGGDRLGGTGLPARGVARSGGRQGVGGHRRHLAHGDPRRRGGVRGGHHPAHHEGDDPAGRQGGHAGQSGGGRPGQVRAAVPAGVGGGGRRGLRSG